MLLVEDAVDIRALLRDTLESGSIEVAEAKNGVEGLGYLRDDPSIGLVFLDMHMPDMDGTEMLRRIREDPALTEIPVVLMTGESSASMKGARDLGAVGLLQKPFRSLAILQIARRFVGA